MIVERDWKPEMKTKLQFSPLADREAICVFSLFQLGLQAGFFIVVSDGGGLDDARDSDGKVHAA